MLLSERQQRVVELYKSLYTPEELIRQKAELDRAIDKALDDESSLISRYPSEFIAPIIKPMRAHISELQQRRSMLFGDS